MLNFLGKRVGAAESDKKTDRLDNHPEKHHTASSANAKFSSGSEENSSKLIRESKGRLVLICPTISEKVSAALCQKIKRSQDSAQIDIIVDTSYETFSLGYGPNSSPSSSECSPLLKIQQLAKNHPRIRLMKHENIRLGLVVADEQILVYSPPSQLIDDKKRGDNTLNSIIIARKPKLNNNDSSMEIDGKDGSDLKDDDIQELEQQNNDNARPKVD